MASVEVLAGPERRRRWSIEQKQAIVAAAFKPGAIVRDVAPGGREPSLIYRWRRDLRATVNGFAQVLVAPAGDGVAAPPPMPAIEIEWVGNTRVRIPASVSPALAAAVVEALRGGDPGSERGTGVVGGRPHRHAQRHERFAAASPRALEARSACRRPLRFS